MTYSTTTTHYFTFNLGLENNNHGVSSIQKLKPFKLMAIPVLDYGEWEGQPEKTLVFEAEYKGDDYKQQIIDLCSVFTQDCIAYKVDGVGELAFNKDYDGERYSFDPEFFIN